MVQPTDAAVGMLFAAWLDFAGWGFIIYGFGMVLGGVIAIVWLIVTWGGVTLGPDPVLPPVVEPVTAPIPRPPKSHAAREDDDTHVIPMIPGATPPREDIADEQLVAGLRQLPCGPELARFLDDVDADIRATIAVGPICGTCGRPAGKCQCAPTEETQVVDLCPLTTQDIVVPFAEPTPEFDTTVQRADTQELSAHMEKIRRRERVA
jgi:hypothetical protein